MFSISRLSCTRAHRVNRQTFSTDSSVLLLLIRISLASSTFSSHWLLAASREKLHPLTVCLCVCVCCCRCCVCMWKIQNIRFSCKMMCETSFASHRPIKKMNRNCVVVMRYAMYVWQQEMCFYGKRKNRRVKTMPDLRSICVYANFCCCRSRNETTENGRTEINLHVRWKQKAHLLAFGDTIFFLFLFSSSRILLNTTSMQRSLCHGTKIRFTSSMLTHTYSLLSFLFCLLFVARKLHADAVARFFWVTSFSRHANTNKRTIAKCRTHKYRMHGGTFCICAHSPNEIVLGAGAPLYAPATNKVKNKCLTVAQ